MVESTQCVIFAEAQRDGESIARLAVLTPSSWRRSARTKQLLRFAAVEDLVLSQDDKSGTHDCFTRQFVLLFEWRDLQFGEHWTTACTQQLTGVNRLARFDWSKSCWKRCRNMKSTFFFHGRKAFFSVAPPMNAQNDRVYAPLGRKKREVSVVCRQAFNKISSALLVARLHAKHLRCTGLIFVEPVRVKIDDSYYCDVLLMREGCHDAIYRAIDGDVYTVRLL